VPRDLATAGWSTLAGAGVTWLVAFVVGEWARRRRILDVPNARSSHVRPTPRLGGIGIAAGVVAALLLSPAAAGRVAIVLALGLTVSAASLLDDVRGLSARVRLLLHVAVALAAVWALQVADVVAPVAGTASAWVFAAVAVVWIVGFLNAFNFMDGIDGIAAGQALIASAGWVAIGVGIGDAAVVRLGAAVAGASIGFLALNWPPARIFMGDVGSAFLGFLLATLPLAGNEPLRLAGPALLLAWPFLFDTAFTLVRRASRGENLMEAHRSHLYQRLTRTGLSHAQVTSAYVALAAAGLPVAWLLAADRRAAAALGLAAIAGLAAALWWVAQRREARLDTAGAPG
jgi:glycosyltransferase WbpL